MKARSSDLCADCPTYGQCALAKLEALPPAERPIGSARYGPAKTYRSGEYLLLHQSYTHFLAPVICRGVVAVFVINEGGEEILLHALGPGNVVGLSNWFQRTSSSSLVAKAITDVTISLFAVSDPLALLKRSDVIRDAYLEQIGTHLQATQRASLCARCKDGSACMLLAIHELIRLLQLERDSPVIIPYNIPRWFFVSYTGLRPETVSRILTRLRNEGLIAHRKRRLVIPNLPKLVRRIREYSSSPDCEPD